MKKTRLLFVVLACLVAALVFGCSAAQQATPEENFIGSWELESSISSVGDTSAEVVAQVKELGLVCTLEVAQDGTLAIDLFGDTMSGTWEALDATNAAVVINGANSTAAIGEDGKLVIGTDEDMLTFVRAEAASDAS